MLVLEKALGTNHASSTTGVVINGRQPHLTQELLVVPLKGRLGLRADPACRQGSGEREYLSVWTQSLVAVEAGIEVAECWLRGSCVTWARPRMSLRDIRRWTVVNRRRLCLISHVSLQDHVHTSDTYSTFLSFAQSENLSYSWILSAVELTSMIRATRHTSDVLCRFTIFSSMRMESKG